MPARSTHLIFHNNTPFLLSRTGGSLDHGVFTEPFSFVDRIAPGQTVDWETESDGVLTGTEGRGVSDRWRRYPAPTPSPVTTSEPARFPGV
jgi:hypothetical protein